MGAKNNTTTGGNSTEIDTLSLNIEVKGADSGKSVRSLATAISRLNEVLKDFNNEKFSNFLDTMSQKFDPFLAKVGKVSRALESLSDIVKRTSLDKAVEQATSGLSATETGKGEINLQRKDQPKSSGGQAQQLGQIEKIKQMNSVVDVLKGQLAQVQAKMNDQNLSEDKLLKLKNQELKLTEQIAKAEKGGGDDDGKKTKKKATAMGKLMKSFGRIAMYRAVRRAIQEITQAFTESIDGIARYNSEFRDTMGSLQSSMAKLKTSIGVGLYQVLIVLEPVITAISNGIVNLANSLSKVTANLRGVAEYTKINTDYMKDYQSATQGALLSFDTFNTLSSSQGIDYSQMLDTGTDALDEENFTDTENSLKRIFELIQTIGETAQKVWNGGLKDIVSTILDVVESIVVAIADIVEWLDSINLGNISALETVLWGVVGVLGAIVAYQIIMIAKNIALALTNPFTLIVLAIGAVVAAIAVLVANWDDVVNFFKTTCEKVGNFFTDLWDGLVSVVKDVCKKIGNFFTDLWHGIANGFANIINGICNGFISFVNMLIDGINALLTPINEVGQWFGASESFAQIPHWNAEVNWKPYADGGMFEGAGTMYALAGESGAEIVAQGSQGTGVANVEQIADAVYRGNMKSYYDYGIAQNGGIYAYIGDINALGTAVARSTGFKNETKRQGQRQYFNQ